MPTNAPLSDQQQTPISANQQEHLAPELDQTPQQQISSTSLNEIHQSPQWIQNPYIGYPAAIYNSAPHMLYPRPGIVGPLDYYQFQPQLAAMMSAGLNTRELCVVCGDKAR